MHFYTEALLTTLLAKSEGTMPLFSKRLFHSVVSVVFITTVPTSLYNFSTSCLCTLYVCKTLGVESVYKNVYIYICREY